MKLSVSNLFWQGDVHDDFYQKLRNLNIKYLEIAPKKTFTEFPKIDKIIVKDFIHKLKKNYNIQVISLQSILFGENATLFRSEDERSYLFNFTKDVIDFAHYINCENIVFGNPRNRDGYKSMFENDTIQFFSKLGSYAKQKNVILSIEPNPIIYYTNFLNTNIETLNFIKKVNHSNIRMNLDIGSMIYNKEIIENIIDCSEYISHIHISEPFLKEIQSRPIHNYINRLNYDKFVSIETLNINDSTKLESMVKYVRSVINLED
jgi:sugar phosphate isomerase/epimerase